MLKIEFYKPQKIQVATRKSKYPDQPKIQVFETTNILFAKSISRDILGSVSIATLKGFYFSYSTHSDGERIKSILPFNENHTKQFKIL